MLFILTLNGQIVINEIMSSNSTTIYDENGNSPDWIELYSDTEINLMGYGLSDDTNDPFKWVFQNISLEPESYLLIFASGDDDGSMVQHWETVINWGDPWKYFIGTSNPPLYWSALNFDDSDWLTGPSGFGYGDGDDATTIPSVMSVFIRKSFNIESIENILNVILHVDYDDAFVAYLNGIEIARANIGIEGIIPNYNQSANEWHEAEIYTGGIPEKFDVNMVPGLLNNGENILAIQVHNYGLSSSDMSLIPFLTLGMDIQPENSIGTPDILNFPLTSLHSNFKIASDGEPIILTHPSGNLVDMVDSTTIPTDVSFGRQPDGDNEWFFYSEPTPGSANNTDGFNEYCQYPEFSHEGGFYPYDIEVSISIDSEFQQIFYSLDGSIPTEDSFLYTNPISIESTKVLRAVVIHPICSLGIVITKSYLIDEQSTLPVVSLTSDPINLWDEDYGIYVLGSDASADFPYFGANFWEDWERPVHIEYFDSAGELGFNLDAGIKIFGGWSRGQPQKSLSIFARESYGSDKIEYQIFPDKDINEFRSIVLRNSGNDWFGSGQESSSMLRDGMMTGLMDETGLDHQAYQPAIVYINGDYWGIHNIREKVNEEFLASNNPGVDPDELDELELSGNIIEGDNQDYLAMINFIENNNLSETENYIQVADQMDIENFIDYFIIQIYLGNTDWPGNNIKYWRPHIAGAKWKWILYDTDFGYGLFWWATEGSNVEHNTLLFALNLYGPEWPNPPWSTFLFRSLMENEEFQHLFINHFCYYLNTRFNPEYVESHISDIADNISPEMPTHINRWGGNLLQWDQNINSIQQFGSQRSDIIFTHLADYFGIIELSSLNVSVLPSDAGTISLSGQNISENPWVGEYFNDVPISVNAAANPGYSFSHWEGISEVEQNMTITLNGDLNLNAVFVENDNIGNSVFINEILASNDATNVDEAGEYDDWMEIYNAGDEAVNIGGLYLTDDPDNLEKWMIPLGTEIQSNDFLLIWCDEDQEQGELHTNFKLNVGGESLLLVNYDGITILDSINFGIQSVNISFGRINDGDADWQYFNNPTPDSSNTGSTGNLMGDLNSDGFINVLDVVIIVNLVLDAEYNFYGDMNEDDTLNILDIVALVSIIIGT